MNKIKLERDRWDYLISGFMGVTVLITPILGILSVSLDIGTALHLCFWIFLLVYCPYVIIINLIYEVVNKINVQLADEDEQKI